MVERDQDDEKIDALVSELRSLVEDLRATAEGIQSALDMNLESHYFDSTANKNSTLE